MSEGHLRDSLMWRVVNWEILRWTINVQSITHFRNCVMGATPITQLRKCVMEILHTQGKSPNVVILNFHTIN